jgi:hypothetical protein
MQHTLSPKRLLTRPPNGWKPDDMVLCKGVVLERVFYRSSYTSVGSLLSVRVGG